MLELDLMSYYPAAYTDISDDPGDAYATVPGTSFKLTGFTPIPNPCWTLQATPHAVVSGSTATISIPDLVLQIGGVAGTTAMPEFSVANVPLNTPVVLFTVENAGNFSFGFNLGTYPTDVSVGVYPVLVGSFTTVIPAGTTSNDLSVLFQPA